MPDKSGEARGGAELDNAHNKLLQRKSVSPARREQSKSLSDVWAGAKPKLSSFDTQATGALSDNKPPSKTKKSAKEADVQEEPVFHSLEKKVKHKKHEDGAPSLLDSFGSSKIPSALGHISSDVVSALSALKAMGAASKVSTGQDAKKKAPEKQVHAQNAPRTGMDRSKSGSSHPTFSRTRSNQSRSSGHRTPPEPEDEDTILMRAEVELLRKEKERLEWMAALGLPFESSSKAKLVCMFGCQGQDAVVTHVCRECSSYLCKFCMSEHMVGQGTRHHELGTLAELRLSWLQKDGWNTRGLDQMGLQDDEETMHNLSACFAVNKYHTLVDGVLKEVCLSATESNPENPQSPPADANRASFVRSASSSSEKSSASGGIGVGRTEMGSQEKNAKRMPRRHSVPESEKTPDSSDFLRPPRRPISPLFRRSVSPQNTFERVTSAPKVQTKMSSDYVLNDDTAATRGGEGISRVSSGNSTKSKGMAGEQATEDERVNFFDELPDEFMRRRRDGLQQESLSFRLPSQESSQDLPEREGEAQRILLRKGSRQFSKSLSQLPRERSNSLRSDTMESPTSIVDKIARLRSTSPINLGVKQKMSSANRLASSLSPVRMPHDKTNDGAVGRFLMSLDESSRAILKPNIAEEVLGDNEEGVNFRTSFNSSAHWSTVRKAMSHHFINEQMETHGAKSFFEYRSNIMESGIPMFVELSDRHLLVAKADNITKPIYKLHLLEMAVMPRPEKLRDFPAFLFMQTADPDPQQLSLYRKSFDHGRAFFCFKNMSEVHLWNDRIRVATRSVLELPPKERFGEEELVTSREPEEDDTVTLQNLCKDGPLSKFNGCTATVAQTPWDSDKFVVTPKGSSKTIKVKRENMVTMRMPMSNAARAELDSKALAYFSGLQLKQAKQNAAAMVLHFASCLPCCESSMQTAVFLRAIW